MAPQARKASGSSLPDGECSRKCGGATAQPVPLRLRFLAERIDPAWDLVRSGDDSMVRDLGSRQRVAHVCRHVPVAARGRDALAEHATEHASHASGALVSAFCFHLGQDGHCLRRGDPPIGCRADQRIGHAKKPSNLVESAFCPSFALAFRHPLLGSVPEACRCGDVRGHLRALLFEGGIISRARLQERWPAKALSLGSWDSHDSGSAKASRSMAERKGQVLARQRGCRASPSASRR